MGDEPSKASSKQSGPSEQHSVTAKQPSVVVKTGPAGGPSVEVKTGSAGGPSVASEAGSGPSVSMEPAQGGPRVDIDTQKSDSPKDDNNNNDNSKPKPLNSRDLEISEYDDPWKAIREAIKNMFTAGFDKRQFNNRYNISRGLSLFVNGKKQQENGLEVNVGSNNEQNPTNDTGVSQENRAEEKVSAEESEEQSKKEASVKEETPEKLKAVAEAPELPADKVGQAEDKAKVPSDSVPQEAPQAKIEEKDGPSTDLHSPQSEQFHQQTGELTDLQAGGDGTKMSQAKNPLSAKVAQEVVKAAPGEALHMMQANSNQDAVPMQDHVHKAGETNDEAVKAKEQAALKESEKKEAGVENKQHHTKPGFGNHSST